MPLDIDPQYAGRRARYRSTVRRLAWFATAAALLNLAFMWMLWHPALSEWIPQRVPVIGTAIGVVMYFVGMLIPIIQQGAVHDLHVERLRGPVSEPWTVGLEARNTRARLLILGTPAALSVLMVWLVMSEARASGSLLLTLWSFVPLVWVGLTLGLIQLLSRVAVRYWLAHGHDRALRASLVWAPGADAPALRALAYRVLNAPGAATRVVARFSTPGQRRSIQDHAAYLAIQAQSEPDDSAEGFRALHDAAPDYPHGALGLSEVVLARGKPALGAARHAHNTSASSLSWGHLALYAQANEARSLALVDDHAAALALVNELLQTVQNAPPRRRGAILHRLALALEPSDRTYAQQLRERAASLDPSSAIGRAAVSGDPPIGCWP